jgi:O-antigen/teichoic acid export membrane protein
VEKPKAPGAEEYGRRMERTARGAGTSSLANGLGRLVAFAIQFVLARLFGPAQLGLYVLGTTAVMLANVLAQAGLDSGVVRYVSQYRAAGDDARVKGVIVQALLVSFALSMLLGAALFFGAGLLARGMFDKPALEQVFRIFALSLPFLTLMSMAFWATEGFQIVKYSVWVREVVQPLGNLVLIVAAYVLGSEVLGVSVSYVVSMAFGCALAMRYLRRIFPKITDTTVPAVFETGALFRVSGPMIVVNSLAKVNTWTATLAVGVFATASAVGVYNAAARTGVMGILPLVAFSGIFSPMIAELHGRGATREMDALYKDVSRWVFTFSLLFFFGAVLLARDVMALFGPEFVSGWPVLVIIAAGQLFAASVGSTVRILAMTGRQRLLMYTTLGSLLLNVALNLLLVPPYGILGSAVATATATVASNALTLAGVNRSLGLWPYTTSYLKPVAVGGLAAVAVYFLRLAAGAPSGAGAIVVVGGLYSVLFAAGLFLAGPTESDRRFMGAIWSAARRKLGQKAGAS